MDWATLHLVTLSRNRIHNCWWRNALLPRQAGLPDGTYILVPKIPIWVYFGRPYSGKLWNILYQFGIFFCHLVHFMAVWYILWSFGIFCDHLVQFVIIWCIWCLLALFSSFWYAVPRKIWQPCCQVCEGSLALVFRGFGNLR
jgi:hypothetical protein